MTEQEVIEYLKSMGIRALDDKPSEDYPLRKLLFLGPFKIGCINDLWNFGKHEGRNLNIEDEDLFEFGDDCLLKDLTEQKIAELFYKASTCSIEEIENLRVELEKYPEFKEDIEAFIKYFKEITNV